jgi:prophage regulatory protein
MADTTLIPSDCVAARRGRSRSQIYVDIRRGVMPPPLPARPGRKASVWPAYEIDAINRAEIAGSSDDEIRALVRQLIQQSGAGHSQQQNAA